MTLSDLQSAQRAETVQFNNYRTAYDVVIPIIFLQNNKHYRKILFDALFDGDNNEAITQIQRVLEEYNQKCYEYYGETCKVKDKLYRSSDMLFFNKAAREKEIKRLDKEVKHADNLLKKAILIQKEFEAYL